MKVLPPATIGILGGGQLGRMLALAARRMGYRVAVLDPSPDSPCGQVSDERICAPFSDVAAALKLGAASDVVTYEFENVEARAVEALESEGRLVRPGTKALKTCQNRLSEKEFLRSVGVATADFAHVDGPEALERAARKVGFPAVLKTAQGGYDGKGQALVASPAEARQAFARLGRRLLIWERRVPFVKELSVVAARDARGKTACYPISENIHVNNILDTSIAPARVLASVARKAEVIAQAVGQGLRLVGTFCVELFLLKDGSLLANEIAPRPHNSGHYTIDACASSQFEQQLRAVCGLSLGSTEQLRPAVMFNLLGEGRGNRLIGAEGLLKDPDVRLHLYGKGEARPGRKMGHVTVLAASVPLALRKAKGLRRFVRWG